MWMYAGYWLLLAGSRGRAGRNRKSSVGRRGAECNRFRDGERRYKLPVTRGGWFVRAGPNRPSQQEDVENRAWSCLKKKRMQCPVMDEWMP